ncbi:MAG: stage II sporulation protein M [Pseudomonadota bacterium]
MPADLTKPPGVAAKPAAGASGAAAERLAGSAAQHDSPTGGPMASAGDGGAAERERLTLIRSARFRAERERGWRRLEQLVTLCESRGPRALSFADARELAELYRQAATSLSVAREISLDRSLLNYLEALTARAYLAVYAPQESLGGLFSRFFRQRAPQAMRALAPFILAGLATLLLGTGVGYALFLENEAWYDVLVPRGPGDPRGPDATREDLLSVIYDEGDRTSPLDRLGAFAAYLFSHNTRIAIFAFSLGAFACLPTFLLVFYQGLFFGAFVALHVDRGVGIDIAGWLSVHGVTELSAIFVAAGAGYAMGYAVLFPGQRRRADALFDVGRDAVTVAIVAGLMLLVAAILEGFFRQLVQDTGVRLAIGWGVGALWLAWFAFGGRRA